jgi:hypothetical protein
MERAGRVLSKLKLASHGITDEQLACSAWPVAVGKKIANRTTAVSLIRDRLVIQVEDMVWQKQLWALRHQILRPLEETLGRKLVNEVEFRIHVAPRRQPVRATVSRKEIADEADEIRDPLFRSIYKAARRKATA